MGRFSYLLICIFFALGLMSIGTAKAQDETVASAEVRKDFELNVDTSLGQSVSSDNYTGIAFELKLDGGTLSVLSNTSENGFYNNPGSDSFSAVGVILNPEIFMRTNGEGLDQLEIKSPTLILIQGKKVWMDPNELDGVITVRMGSAQFEHESDGLLDVRRNQVAIRYFDLDLILSEQLTDDLRVFACLELTIGGDLGEMKIQNQEYTGYAHDVDFGTCVGLEVADSFTMKAHAELEGTQPLKEGAPLMLQFSGNLGVEVADIGRSGLGIFYEYKKDYAGTRDSSDSYGMHTAGLIYRH